MKPIEAERAAEHYLREAYGATHCIRAIRTGSRQGGWGHRQKLWGCDVLGLSTLGRLLAAQATTSRYHSAVSNRRAAIVRVPWPADSTVLILHARPYPAGTIVGRWVEGLLMQDAAHRAGWGFIVHEFANGAWRPPLKTIIAIPPRWRKAFQDDS